MFMPSLKCFAFLLVGLFAFCNILNALSSPVEVLLEVVAIQLKTTLPVKESREQRADAKEVIATNFPTPEESKVVSSSTNTPTSSSKPVKPIFLNIPDQLFTNETDYINRPIITDIFSTPKNGSMIIYAVYSALNLRSKQADVSSNNFTLVHGNTSVKNLIGVKAHVEALRDLKFILPYEVTESFYVDIIDYKRQFTYKHLFVEILREEKVGGIGVCAMVSDFNSIGEVKNWISWYKFQQLSNVMLYSIKPVPHIEKEIYPAISKGFVKYYQYQYPLNKYRQNKEQRSIQLAVINSCFFRHKHLYDGMLMIDVDEFVYSPTYPRDLQQALMNLLQHSRKDMFLVFCLLFSLPLVSVHNVLFSSASQSYQVF